jgi:hypothetical protein
VRFAEFSKCLESDAELQELTTDRTSEMLSSLVVSINIEDILRCDTILHLTSVQEALFNLSSKLIKNLLFASLLTSLSSCLSLKFLLNNSLLL